MPLAWVSCNPALQVAVSSRGRIRLFLAWCSLLNPCGIESTVPVHSPRQTSYFHAYGQSNGRLRVWKIWFPLSSPDIPVYSIHMSTAFLPEYRGWTWYRLVLVWCRGSSCIFLLYFRFQCGFYPSFVSFRLFPFKAYSLQGINSTLFAWPAHVFTNGW